MPIYEAICAACDSCLDVYVPAGVEGVPACEACGGARARAGLAAFAIRTPGPSGAKLPSGEFVKGTWGPPPRRVKRRIKTF